MFRVFSKPQAWQSMRAGVVALAFAVTIVGANAQEAPPPDRSSLLDSDSSPQAATPSGDTAWQSGYLFDFSTLGPASGIGQAMADSGVYLNGGETGVRAGNVAGGVKQGAVFNNAGLPLPLYGGTALNDPGRMSIHAMFRQMIWRPDLSETRRGLTIFGGARFGSNQSEIRQYYQAGLSDQGPFASHPHDSINFLAMYQVFNQRLVENHTLLANQGDHAGTMNKGETDFELNDLWQIGAGVSVQPFVEYIVHPDQIGFATPNPRPPSSTTLGMQVAIALPDSLGLPVFVRKN